MKTEISKADIQRGKRALRSFLKPAIVLTGLAEKYGLDRLGEFIPPSLAEAAMDLHKRLGTLERAQGAKTLGMAPAPVAPSTQSCSLYCATNPDGTGKCVYCGHPKAKHTKAARDPKRTGNAK